MCYAARTLFQTWNLFILSSSNWLYLLSEFKRCESCREVEGVSETTSKTENDLKVLIQMYS